MRLTEGFLNAFEREVQLQMNITGKDEGQVAWQIARELAKPTRGDLDPNYILKGTRS